MIGRWRWAGAKKLRKTEASPVQHFLKSAAQALVVLLLQFSFYSSWVKGSNGLSQPGKWLTDTSASARAPRGAEMTWAEAKIWDEEDWGGGGGNGGKNSATPRRRKKRTCVRARACMCVCACVGGAKTSPNFFLVPESRDCWMQHFFFFTVRLNEEYSTCLFFTPLLTDQAF